MIGLWLFVCLSGGAFFSFNLVSISMFEENGYSLPEFARHTEHTFYDISSRIGKFRN